MSRPDDGFQPLRSALKSQYRAGLAMLRLATTACPDSLWIDEGAANPFWQVAYHVLFYTDFYLARDEKAFRPWERHRQEYHFLGTLPWPPHRPPNIGAPYAPGDVLAYLDDLAARIDDLVDELDLAAPTSGFWWYPIPKLEHQLLNLRHLQHHTGQLLARLRSVADMGIEWVGFVEAD